MSRARPWLLSSSAGSWNQTTGVDGAAARVSRATPSPWGLRTSRPGGVPPRCWSRSAVAAAPSALTCGARTPPPQCSFGRRSLAPACHGACSGSWSFACRGLASPKASGCRGHGQRRGLGGGVAAADRRPGPQGSPDLKDYASWRLAASIASGDNTCSAAMVAAPSTPAWAPAVEATILRCSVAKGKDRW